jgi:hypothetical protein
MTHVLTTSRRLVLTAATTGLTSIAMLGAASAQTVVAGAEIDAELVADVTVRDHRDPVRVTPDHWRTGVIRHEDRLPEPTFHTMGRPTPSPYFRAMRRYDLNRNGRLEPFERKSFWRFMAGTGVYGELTADEQARFTQLAPLFDSDSDGRLVGAERTGMDRLIDSLRLFARLDRNGDHYLSTFEVGFSALAPQFYRIDVNRDRYLSRQEVRDEVLRSYRAGHCG